MQYECCLPESRITMHSNPHAGSSCDDMQHMNFDYKSSIMVLKMRTLRNMYAQQGFHISHVPCQKLTVGY